MTTETSIDFKNRPIIIVMGVSGCGKSTIAKGISSKLNIPFIEGDDLHPASNVEKMSQSIPLNDDDRWPWLDLLGYALKDKQDGVVASCSALKRSYRERLNTAVGDSILFIYLDGSRETLLKRVQTREDHFMPTSLLDSQLETLEIPDHKELSVSISIENSIDEIIEESILKIKMLT